MSSHAAITTNIHKFINKIKEKSDLLRETGLTSHDREILGKGGPNRLALTWCELPISHDSGATTTWRRSRAQQLYRAIQAIDEHLFLAFVLTVPPTECVKKGFDMIVDYIIDLNNYEQYRVGLNQNAKEFFDSVARNNGFASSVRYLDFMKALFPVGVENDQGRHFMDFGPPGSEGPLHVSPSPLRSRHLIPPAAEGSLNTTHSVAIQKEKAYVNPPWENLGQVFYPNTRDAIERIQVNTKGVVSVKAVVTMVFPSKGLFDCLMSFSVEASRVQNLAMALYNVRVVVVENIRYVIFERGVRLRPDPGIILKGVLDNTIIDVFGPEMCAAITACRMRKKELEEGIEATELVSMSFTNNPGERATINLALGLEGGTQIKKKLYTRI